MTNRDGEMETEKITSTELARELETMRLHLADLEKCRIGLASEQKKYDELLEAAPDAIVFVDRGGKIMRVNAQFERLFGYKAEEIEGNPLEKLVPPQFREKHRKFVADFFDRPRSRAMGSNLEIYGVRKNGEQFPVDISLSTLTVDRETFATAAVRDISERKQAEEKLMRDFHIQRVISAVLKISLEPVTLDEHLQRILELILSIPHLAFEGKGAIYVVDRDKNTLLLKAMQGFVSPAEEPPCRQRPLGECICGKAAQNGKLLFADCLDERHEVEFENLFPHGHYCVPILDGEEAVGLINVFVREGHRRNEAEEKFLLVIADTLAGIFRHHRIEKEKDRLLEKLANSEKMAALGRLTSNFTHEIRNPLMAIGGLAKRLAKKMDRNPEQMNYVERIVAQVARLEVLVKNLVAFSRSYSVPMAKHDPREIIASLLSKFSERCRLQSVAVETSLAEVPMVHMDRELMEMILENFIVNALDAMPQGGMLQFATLVQPAAGRDFILIRVKDTGTGISVENLPLIFEPLFTTKIGGERPGLGLASSKKIVEAHGGTLTVKSEPGSGTEVTLALPEERRAEAPDYSI